MKVLTKQQGKDDQVNVTQRSYMVAVVVVVIVAAAALVAAIRSQAIQYAMRRENGRERFCAATTRQQHTKNEIGSQRKIALE
mgnify:CR=1 FL=1